MTHRQSFLAPVRHKPRPPSFSGGPRLTPLRNCFRHYDTGKKTKQFIVFIDSCHGHKPTHDVKEEAGGSLEWSDQSSHTDQTEETRTWGHISLSDRYNVSMFGSYQKSNGFTNDKNILVLEKSAAHL